MIPIDRNNREDIDDGVSCIQVDDNSTISSTINPTTLSTVSPTTILTTISTIDDECCGDLELTLENDASANQGQRAGKYEIQAEKVNDRNVWKRDDGQYVVWFNNITDQWTIGSSVGSGGGIFAPSGSECPDEVGSQWTYYVVGSSNTFLDAGNDVSLKCEGKEQLSIF